MKCEEKGGEGEGERGDLEGVRVRYMRMKKKRRARELGRRKEREIEGSRKKGTGKMGFRER